MSTSASDWNTRYETGDLPWDSGVPAPELQQVIERHGIAPGRALELGCGTGTNAIWLARQGFDVTALDLSAAAIEQAKSKAASAGVTVRWVVSAVEDFGEGEAPFDFLFDRGCYHCCRRVDLEGYLNTHRRVTHPGSLCLVLAGSVHETSDSGIPRVAEDELRTEFAGLYDILDLHDFRFEEADGAPGPRGWSCLMRRR